MQDGGRTTPWGAEEEMVKHVFNEMLLSTQIPSFIKIGAILNFFLSI